MRYTLQAAAVNAESVLKYIEQHRDEVPSEVKEAMTKVVEKFNKQYYGF